MINTNGHQPKRCENVTTIMQQVQSCPWNPFKLNEIVTLEKCLQEAVLEDTRLSTILKKIANEGVFVEPGRKLNHLSRKDEDKQVDIDLMKQARLMREEIKKLNGVIEYYEFKLNDLLENEDNTKLQICQLKKSIVSIEISCEASHKQFELTLERGANSLERSLSTIKVTVPDFIFSIPESNLVKQFDSLPSLYRTYLIDLIKTSEHYQQQPQLATQLSFCMKKNTINQLTNYLKAISSLYKDLAQIDEIYSTEIPEEITFLKMWETHIDYLERQVQVPPKRMKVIHQDLSPLEQPILSCIVPDTSEDSVLIQLFTKLSEKLKRVP